MSLSEPDATPCARVVELNAAYFEPQSGAFMPGVSDGLATSARTLVRCPMLSVVIRGYADPRETGARALSQRRAEAMQTFLLGAGVPADQIVDVSGRGQDPRLDLDAPCLATDCDEQRRPAATREDKRSRRADALPVRLPAE